jgi:hypothetical protein
VRDPDVQRVFADDLPHVYQYFAPVLPAAAHAIERAGAFITDHTS